MEYIKEIEQLIDEFAKLPSIGRKTAQKLAFHVLNGDDLNAQKFADAIVCAKRNVRFCQVCANYANAKLCEFCQSTNRDRTKICVVEQARDIYSIESTNEYKGIYHVLGGAIAPLEGIYAENLRIKELIKRLTDVQELILATNSNVNGEATAMYICRLVKPMQIRVTRLASGMPVGADLEYADELTLGKAFSARYEM